MHILCLTPGQAKKNHVAVLLSFFFSAVCICTYMSISFCTILTILLASPLFSSLLGILSWKKKHVLLWWWVNLTLFQSGKSRCPFLFFQINRYLSCCKSTVSLREEKYIIMRKRKRTPEKRNNKGAIICHNMGEVQGSDWLKLHPTLIEEGQVLLALRVHLT